MEEGDKCPNPECKGIMAYELQGECTCHIIPPCFNCVEAPLVCDTCGLTEEE
jgi:hypothetical protein